MRLESVDLIHVSVPLKRPFHTALGTDAGKVAVLVRVCTDEGVGWGECAAATAPTYTSEFIGAAWLVLCDHLIPRLLDGEWSSFDEVDARLTSVRGHSMAKAAVETALLDAHLRSTGQSLAAYLGASRPSVPVGVVVDLHGDDRDTLAVALARVDEGYRRVKLKIEPGRDVSIAALIRRELPRDVDVWVDANGSYARDDAVLDELDSLGLGLIEQPLAPADWLGHRALSARLATPICLDESIGSVADAQLAADLRAASIINVKPSRVGGPRAAARLRDVAQAHRVGLWVGGLLDLGVNRAVNLAVAALDGVGLPGDISATNRYFDADITDPFVLDQHGHLAVPGGPGTGVEVDQDSVDRFAVRRLTIR